MRGICLRLCLIIEGVIMPDAGYRHAFPADVSLFGIKNAKFSAPWGFCDMPDAGYRHTFPADVPLPKSKKL